MSVRQPGSEARRADVARANHGPGALSRRVRRALVGPPRQLDDGGLFHKVSLIAVLAWVGLGADGLSSSAYGPEEAFRALGEHRYLAVALAGLMVTTVLVISAAYSRIIERFPHGGGGYVVATRLLGSHAGLVSGCALLVDYILTVTVSIAAAGDALFSVLPPSWAGWKLGVEVGLLSGLVILNIRGIRESVLVLTPVFFLFVATHAVVIVFGVLGRVPELPETAKAVSKDLHDGLTSLGVMGIVMLLFHAFSMGGGTYTGIEAVSNGIPMMRHPQAQTAQRTMRYMAVSLAFTATGLLICYLLWDIRPVDGKTMNAVLVERLSAGWVLGPVFVFATMISAAALLVVAAQAGFADGPRVLANMALDSWVPRRFASLSERLTAQNGIVLVGGAAMAALLYTRGAVALLVVMYSINVFLTFSLSLLGMSIDTARRRRVERRWRRRMALFVFGLALCVTILCVTLVDKFHHGGWITLAATAGVTVTCLLTRRHYDAVSRAVQQTFAGLDRPTRNAATTAPIVDASKPTLVMLVTSFGGLGMHTLLNALRVFPNHFHNVVFVSIGVIDSGGFKGADSLDDLRARTEQMLDQFVAAARGLGLAATRRLAVGTDPVEEAERLCVCVAGEFPNAMFVAGHLLFSRQTWAQRLLHNETAYAIQRRLQWAGLNMLILPARIDTATIRDHGDDAPVPPGAPTGQRRRVWRRRRLKREASS